MAEFEAAFPYEETPDQLTAIDAIKRDMAQQKPMDRLICGDVGYGKTEVAIRAAFKAVDAGKQVAVLVPTTILAEQHYRSFSARMAEFPFVDRGRQPVPAQGRDPRGAQARRPRASVDILIGTHRILQKDVAFKDLGLVIIDEEQRFGVEDKEWLKTLRATVDVLTLSATPIPRTLHMSLLGIRDISNLETPPPDRKAIETRITRFDPETIKRAIHRELNRDGQIYFVHNRVYDIAERRRQDPGDRPRGEDRHRPRPDGRRGARADDARVRPPRGRHPGGDHDHRERLDIPNVNTIFINEADKYGLADLHQLRGRVGRYKHRAYAYLLLESDRPVTPNAVKRLKAIEEFTDAGGRLQDRAARPGDPRRGQHPRARAVGPHRERRLRAVLLAAGVGRPVADQPAREAALRLLGRALLAGLPAPRLRPRPAGQGRALPPAGPAPQPRPPGRLPPGAERPLRPPAPARPRTCSPRPSCGSWPATGSSSGFTSRASTSSSPTATPSGSRPSRGGIRARIRIVDAKKAYVPLGEDPLKTPEIAEVVRSLLRTKP